MTDRRKGAQRQFGMIDLETGEVFEDGVPVWVGAKVKWHEDFVMAIQDAFMELAADREMNGEMFRVFMFLVGNLGFENYVVIPQKEISDRLGMPKSNVSRAIRRLIDKKLIFKGPKIGRTSPYKINSKYVWKGKIKNLSNERMGVLKDFQLERQKRSELENQ